jgi:hypothetical protein
MSGPNWLTVVGLVYLIYALGFLTASAFAGGGSLRGGGGDESSGRVMTAFAGGVGMLGLAMQLLGQFTTVSSAGWGAIGLLSLIVVLLGYVVASDRVASAAQGMMDMIERAPASDSRVPGSLIEWPRAAAE